MANGDIFIKKGEFVLPFSSWTLTQSIMPTGIYPEKAHAIAKKVDEKLKAQGKRFVETKEIKKLTMKYLEEVDSKLPERYEIWQKYREQRESGKIRKPLIVLLGGSTGSGKSTIALEVAHRLAIRNVIGTDYIRQILRTMFSEEILPDIYKSTFNAYTAVKIPIAPGEDKIAIGYVEQAKHVAVGIDAIIQRALKEGTDVILEGIHITPNILKDEVLDDPAINMVLLSIENEEEHKVRLGKRGERSTREPDAYLKEFDKIRRIQQFIVEQGSSRGIPVIDNSSFDKSVEAIIKKITSNVQQLIK